MTIEDIKTLESLFIVEMHSAERIFRLIETGMETIYRESKDHSVSPAILEELKTE